MQGGLWSSLPPLLRGCVHAGVRGLYKGLLPDMAKIAPAAAISWTVFERGGFPRQPNHFVGIPSAHSVCRVSTIQLLSLALSVFCCTMSTWH